MSADLHCWAFSVVTYNHDNASDASCKKIQNGKMLTMSDWRLLRIHTPLLILMAIWLGCFRVSIVHGRSFAPESTMNDRIVTVSENTIPCTPMIELFLLQKIPEVFVFFHLRSELGMLQQLKVM